MRTAEEKYIDMALRGRTPEQIRAVAVAREDKALQEYMQAIIKGGNK